MSVKSKDLLDERKNCAKFSIVQGKRKKEVPDEHTVPADSGAKNA